MPSAFQPLAGAGETHAPSPSVCSAVVMPVDYAAPKALASHYGYAAPKALASHYGCVLFIAMRF